MRRHTIFRALGLLLAAAVPVLGPVAPARAATGFAVVNSADFTTRVAFGSYVTLFSQGGDFTDETTGFGDNPAGWPVRTSSGVSVTISRCALNDPLQRLPILYVSPGQINVYVPNRLGSEPFGFCGVPNNPDFGYSVTLTVNQAPGFGGPISRTVGFGPSSVALFGVYTLAYPYLYLYTTGGEIGSCNPCDFNNNRHMRFEVNGQLGLVPTVSYQQSGVIGREDAVVYVGSLPRGSVYQFRARLQVPPSASGTISVFI